MSLNSKLSNLKNKTDITNISTLDLLKLNSKKVENNEVSDTSTLPNVEQQKPTEDIIIPSSVGDVVSIQNEKNQIQKDIEESEKEIENDLNIKKSSFSLNSLKNSVIALLNNDEKTNEKPDEKISIQKISNDLEKEIGDNTISEELKNLDKEVKKNYKKKTKKDIPDDINSLEVIEEINNIIEDIPNTDDISLTDFEIINTKSKKGYTKTIVGFKKDTPKEISEIATYARKVSGNLIKPRTMNILNIQNINKTQLKDSSIKLPMKSYTFKPDHTKLKVSKFNRFIISIQDDFESTNELYIYLQESRTKFVTKTKCDIEFIGKLIYSFYLEGIEVTKRKLQFKDTQNPLLRLVPDLVKSKQFKVKPFKIDEENQTVKALKIKYLEPINEWMSIIIKENNNITGLYDIYAIYDENWKIKINEGFRKSKTPLEITYLHSDDFIEKLVKFYNNDIKKFKTAGLDVDDTDIKYSMLLNNLKHRNLRKVFIEMLNHIEDDNKNNLEIIKTYSQLGTKKLLELEKQDDYNAEVIIGKSDTLEYFILSYYAMLIKGGDSRAGRDYITTPEYYQKYNVKDKRKYEERVRTILTKEEKERNYHSRPYMFKIEYKSEGKEKEIIAKTFDEINNKLNIF